MFARSKTLLTTGGLNAARSSRKYYMKHELLIEILRKLKRKPHLMRKVKIFAAVGFVGLLVTGALAIWAGVSAFNYVAVKTSEVIQSPTTLAQIEQLKSETKVLPRFQPLNCWLKAQSLMAVEPWLARHAWDNLMNLKTACLEAIPPLCNGNDCTKLKTTINTPQETTL